jgi:hypothetical protein
MHEELHLSDHTLIMAMDGELPPRETARVSAHLMACWSCRARQSELETAIADFVRFEQRTPVPVPSADGPHALLKARLAAAAAEPLPFWQKLDRKTILRCAAALALLIGGAASYWSTRDAGPAAAVAVPNPSLTPGAAVLVNRAQVCSAANVKNRDVPSNLRERVLEEYGLARQQARYYEVDYLITPALGGAEDIHNLWPQSYKNTSWNAQVKDALEDHLRDLVCSGEIDLETAQREIAMNWIDAYKKYFRTDRPLEQQ